MPGKKRRSNRKAKKSLRNEEGGDPEAGIVPDIFRE